MMFCSNSSVDYVVVGEFWPTLVSIVASVSVASKQTQIIQPRTVNLAWFSVGTCYNIRFIYLHFKNPVQLHNFSLAQTCWVYSKAGAAERGAVITPTGSDCVNPTGNGGGGTPKIQGGQRAEALEQKVL